MKAARLYEYDPKMNVQLKIEEVTGADDHGARRGDRAGRRRRPVPHRPAHHRRRVEADHGSRRHAAALHHGPRECRLGRGGRQRRQIGQARRRRDLPSLPLLRHLPQLPPRRGHVLRQRPVPRPWHEWRLRRVFHHQRTLADQAQRQHHADRGGAAGRCRHHRLPRRQAGGEAAAARQLLRAARHRRARPHRAAIAARDLGLPHHRRRPRAGGAECWPRSWAPTSSSTAARTSSRRSARSPAAARMW